MVKEMPEPQKVIYDTDMGTGVLKNEIDDGYGLLLCLALDNWSQIDLRGVTVVMGNTFVKECVACTLKVLEMAGRTDVPVFQGAAAPLARNYFLGDPLTESREPYGGFAKIEAQKQHAADFIIDQVTKYPGEISLIPVGPLTNIAMAIEKKPEIVPKIKEIVAMGGEFNAGVILGGFNWWVDPEAARIVCRSGTPLTIVPLDVTLETALTMEMLNSIEQTDLVKWLKVVSEPFMMKGKVRRLPDVKATHLHDPLAVAVCVNPEIALETTELFVDTVTEGPWAGLTVGRHTAFGWSLLPWGKRFNLKKAKVVWKHDISKYQDLWLRAIQSLGNQAKAFQ